MTLLQAFSQEYKERYTKKDIPYTFNLTGKIHKIKDQLDNELFSPSSKLSHKLNTLIKRSQSPIKIAITGQFSSGKSTFLNALLSKDVLPTGITPVTSKVNFIKYAKEYKLQVTYKSGKEEFHNIDNIEKFTDQRKSITDIAFLTVYAPMDILKDITFVDTPGLNSQNDHDTDTTKNVLKDVSGIIWLTLIDNAGKMSETEILEEYMNNFKDKSLCVLNQKDKFTQTQIDSTTNYIQTKFHKYFAKVIPISAKMALESRSHQKEILIHDSVLHLAKDFKEQMIKNTYQKNLSFFENTFKQFRSKIHSINQSDISKDTKLLEESNILQVLEFINTTLRPHALESQEYAIDHELIAICDTLCKEYQKMILTFKDLINIIKGNETSVLNDLDAIQETSSLELIHIYEALEKIMEKISYVISTNIKNTKKHRYQEEKSLLSSKHVQYEYDSFWIDSHNIYKILFYDDEMINIMFSDILKNLKNIEDETSSNFNTIYNKIETSIHHWQTPYALLKKDRELISDKEFSNLILFAGKVHENILTPYHKAILHNISELKKKFAYFSGATSFNTIQITTATIAHFEKKINDSIELYEKSPLKFKVYLPKEEEILTKLKENFGFPHIENFLTSDRNYLYDVIKSSKEGYLKITEERIDFIEQEKQIYIDKIKKIEHIQSDI